MNKLFEFGNGAVGRFIYSDCFNTNFITFHFYLPQNENTMAEDALIPYLLTSCSADYKSFTELNKKLLKLYGAELGCSVSKVGDFLHAKISLSVVNSAFAFDGEDMLFEATKLLISLIFNPYVENKRFNSFVLDCEKRKTIERIESEINNKRAYAKTRLTEIMFKDSPYGKFVYGTTDEVKAITEERMYSAWERFIGESYIKVNVVGKELPQNLFDELGAQLSKFDRTKACVDGISLPLKKANDVTEIVENMDVNQGKLVMGFSSELYGDFKKSLPLLIFSDIFGGGPYSRLFANVREKLSLCYYCSALQRRSKGFLIVDSGVDADKCEDAKIAILKELAEIQSGVVEDSRLEASKKHVADSLLSYYDSAAALDSWYSTDIFSNTDDKPEDIIKLIEQIKKEDIISVAKGIKLHTIFKLMPLEEVNA